MTFGMDIKGGIYLRIDRHTRQLIERAAAALGKTRTEFMVETARRAATDVLLDPPLFVLDPECYGAFMHALDKPPGQTPKLQALLSRTPMWRSNA